MQIIRSDNREMVPASHEDANKPGVWKRVIADTTELIRGRIQMLNWARLPAGKSFQRHYHEDMQEVFVIVSGRARMFGDDDQAELTRGDAAIIAPREAHSMVNESESDVEYIVFGVSTEQDGQTVVVPDPAAE